MRNPVFDHYVTGAAVPVSALRTKDGCGIGEFLDLIPFGGLCKKCGLDLIQILPINDTGMQISPYSAVSAYALHPVYIRLQNLPGSDIVKKEIAGLREKYAEADRIDFQSVLRGKLEIARKIYDAERKKGADRTFDSWIGENPWVKIYGVYKALKKENGGRSWLEWREKKDPSPKFIEDYRKSHEEEVLFYGWLQFHLEKQLRNASETLESIRIALKGDLPILMSEDSADVWMHRKYFRLDKRAGAPPDMYSDDGQNWGFPIYDWNELEKDDFEWWKGRLRQAEKFYHAFRIDHVLGFFRIWAVPAKEESAAMGYYEPYKFITLQALKTAGFSEERIAWLSKPHVYTREIRERLGEESAEVLPYLRRIGDEELFLFDKSIGGTGDIGELPVSDDAKEALKTWYKNRTLLPVGKGKFFNSWHFIHTRGYESLDEHERSTLHALIDGAGKSSEKSWEKKGQHLLSVIKEATEMLVCVEDLGVVPSCVPRVLKKLQLLSLKIGFWTREYNKPGHPFVPVRDYPLLSVATLSVHDSEVFREWWDVSASEDDKLQFCSALEIDDIADRPYTPAIAETVVKAFLGTSSSIAILQVQDFFALDTSLRREPDLERINVPGTVSDLNWTYRIPIPLEQLVLMDSLCSKIQKLTAFRRKRAFPRADGE